MNRRLILSLTLLLSIIVCNAQPKIKHKMLVGTRGGFGQYALHILPIAYDSTVSDITMLKYSDSVETHPFGARQYNLLYKGDSTKMAVQVNAGIYMFHKRYTITEYYKNGNKKCVIYYNKHYT